jgi:hypothetical protein
LGYLDQFDNFYRLQMQFHFQLEVEVMNLELSYIRKVLVDRMPLQNHVSVVYARMQQLDKLLKHL